MILFGQPIARIVAILALILALVAFVSIRSCKSGHQEAEQARQDTRTADATTEAAKDAMHTLEARTGEEAELKEVVAEAAKDIANAEGSDQAIPPAARDAAMRGACRLPNYRDEPACVLLRNSPK